MKSSVIKLVLVIDRSAWVLHRQEWEWFNDVPFDLEQAALMKCNVGLRQESDRSERKMWGEDNVIQISPKLWKVPEPRNSHFQLKGCIWDGFPRAVCRGKYAYPHVFYVDNPKLKWAPFLRDDLAMDELVPLKSSLRTTWESVQDKEARHFR